MRYVTALVSTFVIMLLVGCGGLLSPHTAPTTTPAANVLRSRPKQEPKIITGMPVKDAWGKPCQYVDVDYVWELYDTDIVQFEQTYKDNIIEIGLMPTGEIGKDSDGYYISRNDYNARRWIKVYLREPDAKELSTLYRTLSPKPDCAKEFDKYRIRVRVESNSTLAFKDGYLVEK